MKKAFLSFGLLFSCVLSAQTMAFTVVELKAKDFSEAKVLEEFDKLFDGVELENGAIVLESIETGSTSGNTHRLVWLYPLGEEMMAEDAVDPLKRQVFWAKMGNYIEEWGPVRHGRILSWQPTENEEMNLIHLWDVKVKNPIAFKKGHDDIVASFKQDFKDRLVGFGTYDINKPNGATHWVLVSGVDQEDHLMLYDKLQNDTKFIELIKSRGETEDVSDFAVKHLRVITN
jgi:hypothetical protein